MVKSVALGGDYIGLVQRGRWSRKTQQHGANLNIQLRSKCERKISLLRQRIDFVVASSWSAPLPSNWPGRWKETADGVARFQYFGGYRQPRKLNLSQTAGEQS